MNLEMFFKTMRGYWESAILFTGIKLGIFDEIGGAAMSAKDVSRKLSLDGRGVETLLNALCALGFLSKKGNAYRLTSFSRKHLTRTSPSPLLGGILHNLDMWESWGDLPYVVKKGKPRKGFATSGYKTGRDSLHNFALAMHHGGREVAKEVASSFDFGRLESIIDVGGCTGRYALAIKRKWRAKKAVVLDIPEMIKEAKKVIRKDNPLDLKEITFVAGDFFRFTPREAFDLAIVSNIVHSLSFEKNVELLSRIKKWLEEGGKVLIHDMTLSPSKTKPERAALFAVNMLVNTFGGTVYTEQEITKMAREGGFGKISKRRTASGNLLLLCS